MSTKDTIDFLVRSKFPLLKAVLASGRLDRGNAMQAEAVDYRAQLSSLTPAELDDLYRQYMHAAAEQQRIKAERDEASLFFNLPTAAADFAYWGKAAIWSLDEAVALILGRNPEAVSLAAVSPYKLMSPFAQTFCRLHNLALRAKAVQQLWDPVFPSVFLSWAADNEIAVPTELRDTVAKGTQLRSWRELAEGNSELVNRLKEACAEKDQRIANLEAALAASSASLPSAEEKRDARPQSSRERDNLLKVSFAIAKDAYGHDPNARRSTTVPDIVRALDLAGFKLSDDSIRRYLKEAADKVADWKEEVA